MVLDPLSGGVDHCWGDVFRIVTILGTWKELVLLATKRRTLPFTWGRGRATEEYTNPSVTFGETWIPSDGSLAPSLSGTQVTESETHSGWDTGLVELNNKGSRVFHYQPDVGGAFTMRRQCVEWPEAMATPVTLASEWKPTSFNPSRSVRSVYQGPLSLGMAARFYAFPPFAQSSDAALMQAGTKAIALCAPTNSVANLASSLIELRREGLPKLLGTTFWQSRLKRLRSIEQVVERDVTAVIKHSGDEYLGLEFGWKPLVADVKDVAKSLVQFDERMEQYERDAGRVVRRRFVFPPSIKEEVEVLQRGISPGTNPSGSIWYDTSKWNQGYVVRTRVTTVNQWFSGAFTYHLPRDYQARSGVAALADQARHVLGLDPTPEVLWNVTPWSWAVDWFTSTGDVIHNLTDWSTDGLVLKYGYIMEHSIVRDTLTFVGETGLLARYPQRPDTLILVSEAKVRRPATPFGFGLNLSAFTGRQKAILAALGMSRL